MKFKVWILQPYWGPKVPSRPPYICFWYFGNLGGLFFVWFFIFENFEIVFWIRITLGGVCFFKLFNLRPPYICFWHFGNLGGLFLVWFLVFENLEIVFWIIIPTFWGICLIKLFDLRPPYLCFWFFGTLGGVFWVWFLVLENSKITNSSIFSWRFYRHHKIWNASVIAIL